MKRTVVMFFLGAFIGCGGGNTQSSSPTFSGAWQITAHSTPFGLTITGSGAVQQTGTSVTGQVTLSGTPCATTAMVSGSISGSTATLQLQEGTQPVNFTGTLNADFSSVSGTYTAPSGGCTDGDFGTWSATKTAQ